MTYPLDDHLIEELAAAIAAGDPVPAEVNAAAKASYTWRTVDAELAELVYDSAVEELAGVRSAEGTARQVTFRAPGVEIEIAILSVGTRRLVGQLVPPQRADVELRWGSESRTVPSDELGRFTFDDVPVGPISLRCSFGEEDAPVIQTDWMLL
jgi:hypothetical protein